MAATLRPAELTGALRAVAAVPIIFFLLGLTVLEAQRY